jgi:tRNA-specific 2-thiouridylase
MKRIKRVVVAMSGGVDSSVTAALLKEQGYQVIGMMLRLWSQPGGETFNRCCTPESMALARRVAARLEIPFYAIDAKEVFHQNVVRFFEDGYLRGVTPNPCLVCNRQIRWGFLLEHALSLGADYLATGHYARLQNDDNGRFQLLKAIDREKDQSYVLHVLGQQQLYHALFPLGEYAKPQVRQLARDFSLPVSERPESQDLCFLGQSDYRQYLRRNVPQSDNPGPIIDRNGHTIGQHQGLAFYTIGQRKGLGLSAPHPLYVVDKDLQRNTLIVGGIDQLGKSELVASQVNWVSGIIPSRPFRAEVKIRYRARETWGRVTPLEDRAVKVSFDESLRDITPGQSAVFYDGSICLGGGIIQ